MNPNVELLKAKNANRAHELLADAMSREAPDFNPRRIDDVRAMCAAVDPDTRFDGDWARAKIAGRTLAMPAENTNDNQNHQDTMTAIHGTRAAIMERIDRLQAHFNARIQGLEDRLERLEKTSACHATPPTD